MVALCRSQHHHDLLPCPLSSAPHEPTLAACGIAVSSSCQNAEEPRLSEKWIASLLRAAEHAHIGREHTAKLWQWIHHHRPRQYVTEVAKVVTQVGPTV